MVVVDGLENVLLPGVRRELSPGRLDVVVRGALVGKGRGRVDPGGIPSPHLPVSKGMHPSVPRRRRRRRRRTVDKNIKRPGEIPQNNGARCKMR